MASQFLQKGMPVALIACGSFNPPTLMHLRMLECARDHLEQTYGCNVVEGILSPVADRFGKSELVAAPHRLRMCELATRSSQWLRADGWECEKSEWSRTLTVLQFHLEQLCAKHGGELRLIMVCGADLLDSFTVIKPDGEALWAPEHIERLLAEFGIIVLERNELRPADTLKRLPYLAPLADRVITINDDAFPNKLSSTGLRAALRKRRSIRYCTPDEVVAYIKEYHLYE